MSPKHNGFSAVDAMRQSYRRGGELDVLAEVSEILNGTANPSAALDELTAMIELRRKGL